MLGNTMVGARLKDLRTVLAWLRTRPDIDSRRMALWGDSDVPPNPARLLTEEVAGWRIGPQVTREAEPLGGLLALLGGLFEEKVAAVAVHRGLSGFVSVLDDRFLYLPSDVIIPDSAAAGDLADIAGALAPRPLLLDELVDARNQRVPAVGGPQGVGRWLVAQLRAGVRP